MYLEGNKNNNYYSLTNNELNAINTWNNDTIYSGDYYVKNSYKISVINIISFSKLIIFWLNTNGNI